MKTHEEKATCLSVAKLSFEFAFGKRGNRENSVFSVLYYSNILKGTPNISQETRELYHNQFLPFIACCLQGHLQLSNLLWDEPRPLLSYSPATSCGRFHLPSPVMTPVRSSSPKAILLQAHSWHKAHTIISVEQSCWSLHFKFHGGTALGHDFVPLFFPPALVSAAFLCHGLFRTCCKAGTF